MTTGIKFSPPLARLEGGGYNQDNVSLTKDASSDSFVSLKQVTTGKPPRHLSSMRHSLSFIKLLDQVDLEAILIYLLVHKHSRAWMSELLKIVEHIHACADFSSPGAFYGVFDGHGGTDAAAFVRNNILRFIVEDFCFSADAPPRIEIPQTRVRRSISLEGLNLLKSVLDCNP